MRVRGLTSDFTRSRRLALLLVVLLVATQMIVVSAPAQGAIEDGTTTGFASENGFGGGIDTEIPFVAQVQTISTAATSGNFMLRYRGVDTGLIAYDALPGTIETALEGLSTLNGVNLTVGGVSGAWTVDFGSDLNGTINGLIAIDVDLDAAITVDANNDLAVDPSGLALVSGDFVIVDGWIDELGSPVYEGDNMWEMATAGPPATYFGSTDGYSGQPSGLAYDAANGRLFVSDDTEDAGTIHQVGSGGDGTFGDGNEVVVSEAFGVADPEDVAWDPTTQTLFIAHGEDDQTEDGLITPVFLGADGIGGGNDVVGTPFDLSATVIGMGGLEYRAETDTLLVTDVTGVDDPETTTFVEAERIYELTKEGRLIRIVEIGQISEPADLVIVDDVVYIVDKHEDFDTPADWTPYQDGRLWEIQLQLPNLRPFLDAGDDESIDQGEVLTLTGDSYDDDQTGTLTLLWTKVSGPGDVTFGDDDALSTSVSFSLPGTYELQLSSSDGSLVNTDTLIVEVANDAPTVNAGPDRTVTLPATANLAGSASDDGIPNPPGNVTTTWTKVSGPGSVTFGNASSAATTASFSAAGTYTLRLTASDGVLQASDTMTATVNSSTPPTTPPGGDTFTDDDGSTFEADIEWLAASGITKGCNPPVNDMFCPDDFVTRGQMAAFMVRANGYTDGLGDDLFIDDDGTTFENDIDRLGTAGVTKGCNPPTNDRYCPDDFVTRGQMAAFMVRAFGYTDGLGADLFIDDDGTTFEDDIDRLGTAGVTKGCNPPANDQYCPNDFVTRGQMAAFLHRAIGD